MKQSLVRDHTSSTPIASFVRHLNNFSMFRLLSNPAFRYTPLENEKDAGADTPSKLNLRVILAYVLSILCIAGAGFWTGRYSANDPFQSDFHRELCSNRIP